MLCRCRRRCPLPLLPPLPAAAAAAAARCCDCRSRCCCPAGLLLLPLQGHPVNRKLMLAAPSSSCLRPCQQGGFNRPLDGEATGQKVRIEWLRN